VPQEHAPQPVSNVAGQGSLHFQRQTGVYVGALTKIKVFVDGQLKSTLAVNQSEQVAVSAGQHEIQVKGGGAFSGAKTTVSVTANSALHFLIKYSAMGGLKLIPLESPGDSSKEITPRQGPTTGVTTPGRASAQLVIHRKKAITGFLHAVKVDVDGVRVGSIKNGETNTFDVAAGQHYVGVNGGGLSGKASVNLRDGQTANFTMQFSSMGVLGGGLNFKLSS